MLYQYWIEKINLLIYRHLYTRANQRTISCSLFFCMLLKNSIRMQCNPNSTPLQSQPHYWTPTPIPTSTTLIHNPNPNPNPNSNPNPDYKPSPFQTSKLVNVILNLIKYYGNLLWKWSQNTFIIIWFIWSLPMLFFSHWYND